MKDESSDASQQPYMAGGWLRGFRVKRKVKRKLNDLNINFERPYLEIGM